MAKVAFLIVCISLIFFEITESAKLTCKYEYYEYKAVGNIYYCWIQNKLDIISPETTQIDSESGSHKSGKGNSDVKGIWSDQGGISYLPSGLDRIYSNLVFILIRDGRIKEIHQSDLKQYPKLQKLNLYKNDIEILEDGLFDYNPDLVFVSFTNNKICYVGLNIFDHLTKLRWLALGDNDCINDYAENSVTAVENLMKTVNKNVCECPGYTNQELKFDNLLLEFNLLGYEAFKKKLETLESKFKLSKYAYFPTLQKKLDALKLALENRYKQISSGSGSTGLTAYDACTNLKSGFYSSVVNMKDLVLENFNGTYALNVCNPVFDGKLDDILNNFIEIEKALTEDIEGTTTKFWLRR